MKGLGFDIPESGALSILCSGGMDSTLIALYLAINVPERKPVAFTFGNEKMKEPLRHIFDWIYQKTGYQYPITYFREKTFIRPTVEKILGVRGGVVFTGCNLVVPDQFQPTVFIPGDTPPVRGPALNDQHLRPFIEWTKKDIVTMYRHLGAEDLIPLTRSCGESFTEWSDVCGGCYFCLERAWGLE